MNFPPTVESRSEMWYTYCTKKGGNQAIPKGKLPVSKCKMIHLDLTRPVQMLWFGEFISPERGWKHLTRRLFEYELFVVTEGVLFIADEGREYEVPAGEYFIMSPTVRQHGTRVCRCRFYWMHFRCPALPASISLPVQGKFEDAAAVQAIAAKLLRAENEQARGVRSLYLATELLLELYGQARASVRETKKESVQARLVGQIKEFVFFHRFSDIKVGDLARELGYHEKYLSAVFRAKEGITLKHYLVRQRVAEAKRLLLETGYTMTEVAYYLNFQTPHNFARFFKTETGMTAGQFRAQNASAETERSPEGKIAAETRHSPAAETEPAEKTDPAAIAD